VHKLFVVALREYNAAVRTKAFVIGLLLMPVMMGGSIVIQLLLKDLHDTKAKRFAIVNRTGRSDLFQRLQAKVEEYNEWRTLDEANKQIKPHFDLEEIACPDDAAIDDLRAQLSERVRLGDLFGFVEIGPNVFVMKPSPAEMDLLVVGASPVALPGAPLGQATVLSVAVPTSGMIAKVDAEDWHPLESHSLRYQSNRPTYQDFPRFVEKRINRIVAEDRAKGAALDYGTIEPIVEKVPLVSKGLSKRNPVTGKVEDASDSGQFAPFFVPFGLLMLMFMVIMMSATPLMQGVVEEKMQRIAEVLLGSVRPFELMMGKLIGMSAVSLTITAVYLAGAYWAAYHYEFSEYISSEMLAWFFVFQALAALMYGSLFIAIGAACTDMKETQNLLWPVMLLACLPMFVVGNVLQEPNNPVATGLSFFPFASPMLMIARMAVPPGIPWWQPLVAVGGVLMTTIVCVYVAGRIFRVGLLMQGKGAKLGELVQWVIRG
jgi:ABC-type Na+ efflux pump permease subunit